MVLAQLAEVLVQLLNALFVRLDAFALEALVQLEVIKTVSIFFP